MEINSKQPRSAAFEGIGQSIRSNMLDGVCRLLIFLRSNVTIRIKNRSPLGKSFSPVTRFKRMKGSEEQPDKNSHEKGDEETFLSGRESFHAGSPRTQLHAGDCAPEICARQLTFKLWLDSRCPSRGIKCGEACRHGFHELTRTPKQGRAAASGHRSAMTPPSLGLLKWC